MLSFNVTRSAFIQNKQNEKQLDYRFHYRLIINMERRLKSGNSQEGENDKRSLAAERTGGGHAC